MLDFVTAPTPMGVIGGIESGLPLATLDQVADSIAPDDSKFRFLIVPKATWTRRQRGQHLSPAESEIVARLALVWDRTLEIYRDETTARRFLHTPHQLLDGRTPVDVARCTGAGARLVEDILGRLEHGSAL